MKRRLRDTATRPEPFRNSSSWSRHFLAFLALLILQRQETCQGLVPSSLRQPGFSREAARSDGILYPSTVFSPLFAGRAQRSRLERWRRQQQQQYASSGTSSSTALRMVLTTPESIIEQASTVNLLDDLIDESVRTSPRRAIMMQFDPSSGLIWRRWKGTIFSETWASCVKNMFYASVIFFCFKTYPGIKEYLEGFGTLWGQILSVTTFTLTFFVNQSYALWRKCMGLSRRLQGRLHDIGMNLATHAARKVPSNPDEASTYTASSRQILELMSRYIRLFNVLTYASFTRSHRPILTPRGMRRLVERGLMTAQEREVLVDAAIPATQRHSAILMWMIRLFIEGRAAGHILGGDGFEQQTIEKFHVIRAQYGAIGDELQGRMPLAYAHIVQVLVDLILWMYPVMAFSIGMSPLVAIVGTGLLTISYQGLFDLAKQFLDPYDNENYGKGEDPLCVDTLIAETNAGTVRWMYGFEEMPFSQQRIIDGELYDYLLPVRGYSLEELAQMEEEKIQREKEMEEQRIREEQERLQKEAEEAEREEAEAEEEASYEIDEHQLRDTNATVRELRNIALEGADLNLNQTNGETNVIILKEETDTNEVEDRPIHKVTTLADGTVISLKEDSPNVANDIKPVAPEEPAVPQVAASYLASLARVDSLQPLRPPVNGDDPFVPDLIDYEMFKDLPRVDEIGPDGQEIRLSQMLDDEVFEGEDEVVATQMTFEEYEQRVAETQENTEIELLEIVAVLNAAPGQDQENVFIVKEKKRIENKESPRFNQTQLDGSQLWGLAPGDPDSIDELQQPGSLDENEFGSIQQLSGRSSGSSHEAAAESEEVVGMTGNNGSSESRGSPLDGVSGGPPLRKTRPNSEGDDAGADSGGEDGPVGPSSAELPRYDEGGPGDKEDRQSQMPADQEFEQTLEPAEMIPLTLKDYTEQAEKIMEAAKEERLETEAILMARPGADPLGWDYDDEQLTATTDGTEEDGEEEITARDDSDPGDLEALEMDMPDDEIGMDDIKGTHSDAMEHDTSESSETSEASDSSESVTDEPTDDERSGFEKELELESQEENDNDRDQIKEGEMTEVMDEENALKDSDPEPKATDKIEPIFLEQPSEYEDD